jgi:hypothetical protein
MNTFAKLLLASTLTIPALAQSTPTTPPPKPESTETTDKPFTNFNKEDFTLQISGSYAIPINGKDERYYTQTVAGGYYLWDNIALYASLAGHLIDPDNEGRDTFGGEFNLFFRWHYFNHERWTLFLDVGAGVIYTEDVLPNTTGREGTRFNFTPQGGFGAGYELKENCHLIGGIRYFHVSNAGLQGADRHFGSDAMMFFAGLLWEF